MKKHQLAFSTNAFKQNTLSESIQEIARIGYKGVEIMADAPHMRPDTFTDDDAKEAKKLIDDLGMTVSNVNAFTGFCFDTGDTYHPTWVEADKKERQKRVDHTLRAIELCAIVGSPHISLQPAGPCMGCDVDSLYEIFAEGLHACLDKAKACGVVLGVEPEPGLLIERSDQFDRLKNDYFAAEEMVQMNCDLGHLYCVREVPADVLRSHKDVTKHIHIEDIASQRVHQHLVPGDGAMDFEGIFSAVDEIGYDGFVTVELYPYTSSAAEVAQRAYDHLIPMLED
jgi:sugar phosphate isomerase/epimerase